MGDDGSEKVPRPPPDEADGKKEARDVPKEPITRKKGRPATGKVTGGNYCSAVGCSNCTVRDRKKGVKFTMHF